MSGHGEHESHAGITAEIRARAGAWMDDKMKQNDERLADRLDAAHRRERGDCAKLREALEMVRDAHYTKEVGGELYEGFEVEADDGTGRPLICIVENALSAPPRNCDVPKVMEDPWRAWLDDESNWDEDGNPKLEIHDWLFATATENKSNN